MSENDFADKVTSMEDDDEGASGENEVDPEVAKRLIQEKEQIAKEAGF
jgi:hypothetical protein